MALAKRIEKEKEKAKKHIEKLKEQLENEQDLLDKLQSEYLDCVGTYRTEEAIVVGREIEEVKAKLETYRKTIDSLNDNKSNPVVQRLIVGELEAQLPRFKELEQKARAKAKELQPLHDKLLKGLGELQELNKDVHRLTYYVNNYKGELNKDNLERLGLKPYNDYITERVDVRRYIDPLLIERHQVYKIN